MLGMVKNSILQGYKSSGFFWQSTGPIIGIREPNPFEDFYGNKRGCFFTFLIFSNFSFMFLPLLKFIIFRFTFNI